MDKVDAFHPANENDLVDYREINREDHKFTPNHRLDYEGRLLDLKAEPLELYRHIRFQYPLVGQVACHSLSVWLKAMLVKGNTISLIYFKQPF
jgi:hypothetical protein